MKKMNKITYIISYKKIFNKKTSTENWEEAKKLLEEAARKSKDNIAYLDIEINPVNKNDKIFPFPIPYATFGKQKKKDKKTNTHFHTRIHVDDINKLKKPEINIENYTTFDEVLKKMFH